METVQVKYTGSTPGADANTYTLFSSVVAFPGARMASGGGMKRLIIWLKNAAAGTAKFYTSADRGTTWSQIDEQAVAAAAATSSNYIDFDVEPLPDFKVDWTNGGSAQTTWVVNMALTDERSVAT